MASSPDPATEIRELELSLEGEGARETDSVAETTFALSRLVDAHWRSWRPRPDSRQYDVLLGEFQYLIAPFAESCTFKSGRAGSLRMSARQFMEHGHLVSEWGPSELRLTSFWRRSAVPKHFGSIVKLWEDQFSTQPSAEEVAQSAHLSNVVSLSVSGTDSDHAAFALARSPHLGSLRSLQLALRFQGDGAAEAVTELATQLRELSLGEHDDQGGPSPGGDRACRTLAAANNLRMLERLRMPSGEITADGLEALLGSESLASLRYLDVSGNKLGPSAGRVLRKARRAPLQSLDLSSVGLDAAGLSELLQSPLIEGLDELNVSGNELGDVGAAALAAAPSLQGLKSLNLAHTEMTEQGALSLAASTSLRSLRSLDLSGNSVGDHAISALRWLRLRSLKFSHCEVTDRGLAALVGTQLFRQLERLECDGNAFSADALASLARMTPPLRLHTLLLCDQVSPLGCTASDVRRFATSEVSRRLNVLGIAFEAENAEPHALALTDGLPLLTQLHWQCTTGWELLRRRWGDRVT